MKLTSKIIGTLRLTFSALWMTLGILALVYGLKGLTWVETNLDRNLAAASQNVEVVSGLISEITDVFESVETSFVTVEKTLADAGLTLEDTRPMLDKTSTIITQEIPKALDDVQDTMPNLIQTAGMVDQSLAFLSVFKFTIPIPFAEDLEIGLGVDYDPEVPFKDAIQSLSTNLENIPGQLRSVETDLVTVDLNLAVMSDDLIAIAAGLDQMRSQVADINPELENVIASLGAVQTSLETSRQRLPGLVSSAQKVFTTLLLLLILSQIPSAYLGLLMIKGDFHQSPPEPITPVVEPPADIKSLSIDPDPSPQDSGEKSNKDVR